MVSDVDPLRIVFAGTPGIAATVLQHLLNASHHIVAVYTQADRPAGRGKKITMSPVKTVALEHQLPIQQPLSLKTEEAQKQLARYNPDLMVVAAYGLILPQAVIDLPKFGCINVHVSLLPRWRGAAPIQHAILAGDSTTGVSIMQMDAKLDTGPILLQKVCNITDTDTSASLHDKLALLGSEALTETLQSLAGYQLKAQPQDHSAATYAHKITKADARIDWQQPAINIERSIRAYNPRPVAHCHYQQLSIRVWQAKVLPDDTTTTAGTITAIDNHAIHVQTGQGVLALTTLQLPGGKVLPVRAILNGKPDLFRINQQFQ